MGQSRTATDQGGQRGAVTIPEAARRLRVSRSTLYDHILKAKRAGHPGRVPFTRGDETVYLIVVSGPFRQSYVTNASLDAVLG